MLRLKVLKPIIGHLCSLYLMLERFVLKSSIELSVLVGRSCGFSFIQRSRFVTEARQDRKGIVAARNPWVFIIRRSSLTSDYPQLQRGRKKFLMPCPRKQNKTSYFSALFFWWRRPKYVASYPLFVLSPILSINFVEMMRTRQCQWLGQYSN